MSTDWFVPNRGPFSVVITPYERSDNGGLKAGADLSLTGVIDSVDFCSKNHLENVSSMSSNVSNYVVTESESSIALVEILKCTGANFLASVAYGFRYAKVILTRGAQTWSFLGVIESYEESIRKGKCIGSLKLKQIAIDGENPTYV